MGLSWFLSPCNAAGPSHQVSKPRPHALGARTEVLEQLECWAERGKPGLGRAMQPRAALLSCSFGALTPPAHLSWPQGPWGFVPFCPRHHRDPTLLPPPRARDKRNLYSWIFASGFPEEKPHGAAFVPPAADNDRQIDGNQVILSPFAADKIRAGIFLV